LAPFIDETSIGQPAAEAEEASASVNNKANNTSRITPERLPLIDLSPNCRWASRPQVMTRTMWRKRSGSSGAGNKAVARPSRVPTH
jgi:hypothetical protein